MPPCSILKEEQQPRITQTNKKNDLSNAGQIVLLIIMNMPISMIQYANKHYMNIQTSISTIFYSCTNPLSFFSKPNHQYTNKLKATTVASPPNVYDNVCPS